MVINLRTVATRKMVMKTVAERPIPPPMRRVSMKTGAAKAAPMRVVVTTKTAVGKGKQSLLQLQQGESRSHADKSSLFTQLMTR